jgi:hypothetical protein
MPLLPRITVKLSVADLVVYQLHECRGLRIRDEIVRENEVVVKIHPVEGIFEQNSVSVNVTSDLEGVNFDD